VTSLALHFHALLHPVDAAVGQRVGHHFANVLAGRLVVGDSALVTFDRCNINDIEHNLIKCQSGKSTGGTAKKGEQQRNGKE